MLNDEPVVASPWTKDPAEARILNDVEAIIDLLQVRHPSEASVALAHAGIGIVTDHLVDIALHGASYMYKRRLMSMRTALRDFAVAHRRCIEMPDEIRRVVLSPVV